MIKDIKALKRRNDRARLTAKEMVYIKWYCEPPRWVVWK